jgi:hypothetical protein
MLLESTIKILGGSEYKYGSDFNLYSKLKDAVATFRLKIYGREMDRLQEGKEWL